MDDDSLYRQYEHALEAWAAAYARCDEHPEDERDARRALRDLTNERTRTETSDDRERAALAALQARVRGENPPEDGADLLACLAEIFQGPLTLPRPVSAIDEPVPAPALKLAGLQGALLAQGSVGILSGAGGLGKSTFTAGLAVDVAADRHTGPLVPHRPGPVLLTTWEDAASITARRVRDYQRHTGLQPAVLNHVHVLKLDAPLFGPTPSATTGIALYNARPGRLSGWRPLAAAVAGIRPALTIIDPALTAYTGDSNAGAPVREFLLALTELAAESAVLLIAHSTKAARRGKADPFDAGLVGGSTHWADGVRAAVAMDWRPGVPDEIDMAVLKANYGPSRRVCGLRKVPATGNGSFAGFERDGDWHVPPQATGEPRTGTIAGRSHDHATNTDW